MNWVNLQLEKHIISTLINKINCWRVENIALTTITTNTLPATIELLKCDLLRGLYVHLQTTLSLMLQVAYQLLTKKAYLVFCYTYTFHSASMARLWRAAMRNGSEIIRLVGVSNSKHS